MHSLDVLLTNLPIVSLRLKASCVICTRTTEILTGLKQNIVMEKLHKMKDSLKKQALKSTVNGGIELTGCYMGV